MNMMQLTYLILPLFLLFCSNTDQSPSDTIPDETQVRHSYFDGYWYQGKAEITTYALSQSRYGEIHEGTAVIVQVTEPFSASKQVKLDRPRQAGSDNVSVLKMNRQRSFNTGIYPYRVMTSTFTPVSLNQFPHTLKSTCSVQEWCGQVYDQLNLKRSGQYEQRAFSYFEQEGDQVQSVKTEYLEDELFNRIRIQPEELPTGTIIVVPPQYYNRFAHIPTKGHKATASLSQENGFNVYRITYASLNRELMIRFSSEAPFSIEGWQEIERGAGRSGEDLITEASAINRRISAYWSENSKRDAYLYNELFNPKK